MSNLVALLSISSFALAVSLVSNLLAKKYLKYAQLKTLQEKMLNLRKLQQKLLDNKDSEQSNEEIQKLYQEMQNLSKEFLSFQIKSLAFNLLPFLVGLFLTEILFPKTMFKFPGGIPLIPQILSSAWIYILAYAAFNSLLSIFLGTTPGPWDHAKALAEKQER
jgi:uncharacterized membrane protein (DUF106 family)